MAPRPKTAPAKPGSQRPVYFAGADDMRELIDALNALNTNASVIASVATGTLHFFKRWVPWFIAAAGIAFPALQPLIKELAEKIGN